MRDFTPRAFLASHYRNDVGNENADGWGGCFTDFVGQIEARSQRDVGEALDHVEDAVAEGYHAVGFVSYEAATGLDGALRTRMPDDFPLIWFGLYGKNESGTGWGEKGVGAYAVGNWASTMSRPAYTEAVADIHDYIVAGDTYQVNFTMRLQAAFSGDDVAFFHDLCRAQRARYSAYVDTGSHAVLSASPELFFRLHNGRLCTRPMKGTCPRGRWFAEDEELIQELAIDAKERAENVMIVDLLRNDLGRVSRSGSVSVDWLWQVERYETVNQLVSQVSSEIDPDTGLRQLFGALFPCGSVTGVPKVRTMEIISQLETEQRGIYTGCIGYISPAPSAARDNSRLGGVRACFSVAIRTVSLDRRRSRAEYGVGSGVTHYSSEEREFEECQVKARILSERRPDFDLFETLRCEAMAGSVKDSLSHRYFLLHRHLRRLSESAAFFGFAYNEPKVLEELRKYAALVVAHEGAHRVRLTLTRQGAVSIKGRPLSNEGGGPLRVAVATDSVSSDDIFLYHKTTNRGLYEDRLSANPDCDEVLLYNERGELTEATIGNVVVVSDGRRWTPPRECGLLAGTYRDELIEKGEIEECLIAIDQVCTVQELYLINSVRRWVPLELISNSVRVEPNSIFGEREVG